MMGARLLRKHCRLHPQTTEGIHQAVKCHYPIRIKIITLVVPNREVEIIILHLMIIWTKVVEVAIMIMIGGKNLQQLIIII